MIPIGKYVQRTGSYLSTVDKVLTQIKTLKDDLLVVFQVSDLKCSPQVQLRGRDIKKIIGSWFYS